MVGVWWQSCTLRNGSLLFRRVERLCFPEPRALLSRKQLYVPLVSSKHAAWSLTKPSWLQCRFLFIYFFNQTLFQPQIGDMFVFTLCEGQRTSTRTPLYSCTRNLLLDTSAHCIHYAFSSRVQPAGYQKVTWFSESRPPPLVHRESFLQDDHDDDDSRVMSSFLPPRYKYTWLTVPRWGSGLSRDALWPQSRYTETITSHISHFIWNVIISFQLVIIKHVMTNWNVWSYIKPLWQWCLALYFIFGPHQRHGYH